MKHHHDIVIIGAGPAGLMAGISALDSADGEMEGAESQHLIGNKVLILEHMKSPGRKLLITGGGACNLTNDSPLAQFHNKYRPNGKRAMKVISRFDNRATREFFHEHGVPTEVEASGKVFPASRKSRDVLSALTDTYKKLGGALWTEVNVTAIDHCTRGTKIVSNAQGEEGGHFASPKSSIEADEVYGEDTGCSDETKYLVTLDTGKTITCNKLVIAAGGITYPATGSDGSIWPLIRDLLDENDVKHSPLAPALSPLTVYDFPYASLEGLSFSQVKLTVHGKGKKKNFAATGDILFTDKAFSGPLAMDASTYTVVGDEISIDFLPNKNIVHLTVEITRALKTTRKQTVNTLKELIALPNRFIDATCEMAEISPDPRNVSKREIYALLDVLKTRRYRIECLGRAHESMITRGGISLGELDVNTMQCLKIPRLYFIGEIVDVDGATGGYNLQWAFSSGHVCGNSMAT